MSADDRDSNPELLMVLQKVAEISQNFKEQNRPGLVFAAVETYMRSVISQLPRGKKRKSLRIACDSLRQTTARQFGVHMKYDPDSTNPDMCMLQVFKLKDGQGFENVQIESDIPADISSLKVN